jgi:hypothetical protein
MSKLLEWQRKLANWKVIIGLIVAFIIIEIAVLPNISARINDYSNDAGVIDLQLHYSVDKLYEMVEAYGEDGRRFYITFSTTGDVVYPIVYSSLFSLIITLLYRRAFLAQSIMHRLPLLVYLTLVFDLIENACIITVMVSLPNKLTTIAQLSNMFTMAKWSMAGVSIILLLIGLIVLPFKRATPPTLSA